MRERKNRCHYDKINYVDIMVDIGTGKKCFLVNNSAKVQTYSEEYIRLEHKFISKKVQI